MSNSGHATPVTPAAMSPPRRFSAFERSPSPRVPRLSTPSRLPSISSGQPFEFDDDVVSGLSAMTMGGTGAAPLSAVSVSRAPNGPATVFGFSASTAAQPQLNTAAAHPQLSTSPPAVPHLVLAKGGAARPLLSPTLTSPTAPPGSVDVWLPAEPGSPRPAFSTSPRASLVEFPPRSRRNSSRRNSTAIVSISLSSRSRSRTPRGSTSVLPDRSGSGTPSKAPTPKGDASAGSFATGLALTDAWAPGVDDMGDWQPAGGMLLDDEGDDSFTFDDDFESKGRSWTAESEASAVADVLRPGMLFGEGIEFEGDLIQPAVGRTQHGDTSRVGLPLRRDGSQFGVSRTASGVQPRPKKVYEVIRQLGSGSYAVVYLVRERGGREREYALKCLSKKDLEEEQLETQLFEATIHLSLPIHRNLVTLHDTLQTKNWLFLMLELCPGEDLFYWLERSRDASPPPANSRLPPEMHTGGMDIMSSSGLSSSSIPFSTSQLFSNIPSSFTNSPSAFSPNGFGGSPASLLFAHHNGSHVAAAHSSYGAATPPTPSLLSAFSANTLLTQRRLRLIASMFSQMCEAVAVCHNAGVSHRDIKPENFICCDSVELEAVDDTTNDPDKPDFGPQAKRKVIVKLTDFGLSTTEVESGDVECGSKPYMSYECRNNLGPTYHPAPADVWSLGIVLINMLFHRNPWKDPTEGDPNFDTFMMDPIGFFTSKFTGIGKEVATYLAERVLCLEYEDRVTARELGIWVRSLPEMIGGRRAVQALKVARLESRAKQTAGDKGLFVKSPISNHNPHKSAFTSALTSTLASAPLMPPPNMPPPPVPQIVEVPGLASLPPPSELAHATAMQQAAAIAHPAPTPDLDGDDMRSATTYDDNPTPTDTSALVSPEPTEGGDVENVDHGDDLDGDGDDADRDGSKSPDDKTPDERSLSTQKRRKRGVRKGKAAKAAMRANSDDSPSREERDAFVAELVSASEELARDLSQKKHFDASRDADFPPLGTSPAQVAAARKSRWKEFLAMSKGNPQLEALAKRVADRDQFAGGTWSAPAKLQAGHAEAFRPHTAKHAHTSSAVHHAATTHSGFTSSVATASSSASSSYVGGPDDDDWRRHRREREREREREQHEREALRAREKEHEPEREPSPEAVVPKNRPGRRGTEDSSSRSRAAALAAAAISAGMEPMGSFGRPSHLGRPPHTHLPHPVHSVPSAHPPTIGHRPPGRSPLASTTDRAGERWAPPTSSVPMPIAPARAPRERERERDRERERERDRNHDRNHERNHVRSYDYDRRKPEPIAIKTNGSAAPAPAATSSSSLTTITGGSPAESPNKPKLKGQIQSLAKMLGGLKAKGRD